ncbi:MAG TPA: hypothetical protein VF257_11990 [Solirubrobacteraceae bacterium]
MVDLGGIEAVIEPTVGLGSFLAAAPEAARAAPWICFDIHADYVETARNAAKLAGINGAQIEQKDAFTLSPADLTHLNPAAPVLAIGNPPWVTSAAQAHAGRANLPVKSNGDFALRGLDALTGQANFDIAEAILLRIIAALDGFADWRLAFLVKRSVAMKLARRLLGRAEVLSFSSIDAFQHFGASVDAGLFYARVSTSAAPAIDIAIADELGGPIVRRAGLRDTRFVEDLDAYSRVAALEAARLVAWRQGIKHDLAKVLELRAEGDGWKNGFGEMVDVEEDALAPLYKSSDLAHGRPSGRMLPLYQTDLTGPVPDLDDRWPRLAAYLRAHEAAFASRRSRIYCGKHPFMLFGVGPYVLAPWKVAVSGLYKTPAFRVLGPDDLGRPALVDDTCYLLPFDTEYAAKTVADHLNGESAQQFIASIADGSAKRPFTKAVLSRVAVPCPPLETAPGQLVLVT